MDSVSTAAGRCATTVAEDVCVDADVAVTPVVEAGPATTTCLGQPQLDPACRRDPCCTHGGHHGRHTCYFRVRQTIRVCVPLTWGAKADATVAGVACGTPRPGPCPP